MLHQYK